MFFKIDVFQNFTRPATFLKETPTQPFFHYYEIFIDNLLYRTTLVAASEKYFRELSSHNHTYLKQRKGMQLKQKFRILLPDFLPVCLQAPFDAYFS